MFKIMPSPIHIIVSLLHWILLAPTSSSALSLGSAHSIKMPGSMTQGVGLYRTLVAKNPACVSSILRTIQGHISAPALSEGGPPPKRATVVTVGTKVVLVEEWDSKKDFDGAAKWKVEDALVLSQTSEYFPEALHISNPIDPATETVGILVRQKTSSTENGGKLRDAQREAYERQMTKEPGCTGCIILAGSSEDDTQVRIVELWKTMNDFYFHETSDWHAKGEEKVVPLVIDMDCDFVKGWQLIQDSS